MTASWLTAPSAPRMEVGAVSEMYRGTWFTLAAVWERVEVGAIFDVEGTAIEATPTATPDSSRPASTCSQPRAVKRRRQRVDTNVAGG